MGPPQQPESQHVVHPWGPTIRSGVGRCGGGGGGAVPHCIATAEASAAAAAEAEAVGAA